MDLSLSAWSGEWTAFEEPKKYGPPYLLTYLICAFCGCCVNIKSTVLSRVTSVTIGCFEKNIV